MQALELMKTHVVKTTPEASLSEAVDLMDIYQVNGLPVVDSEGRLCGMITEHDILSALLPKGGKTMPDSPSECVPLASLLNASAGDSPVGSWMTRPAIFIEEKADITEAALLLLRHGLKRLPVVSTDGQVIGTLNRIDVFQAFFEGNL